MVIITNNQRILSLFPEAKWVAGGALEVLIECRRRVHAGASLVAHPLMGDIHLLKNPFRTVILGGREQEETDLQSLQWIEESIAKFRSAAPAKGEEILEDYQTIDFELIQAAIAGTNSVR
jgi:hypothetical protein